MTKDLLLEALLRIAAGDLRVGIGTSSLRLTGTVCSHAQRAAAETVVQFVYGERSVENQIEVRPQSHQRSEISGTRLVPSPQAAFGAASE